MALIKYELGKLIELTTETNSNYFYGPKDVRGMTITKEVIPTKADVSNTDLKNFLVIHPNEFIFNPRTHGKRIGFGYNDSNENFIISWNNIGFKVQESKKNVVLPKYLFLHFNRLEWDREACFRSWGSSTEVFSWEALCEMKVDIPPIEIQRKYVAIYESLLANLHSYEKGLDDLKLVCDGYVDKIKKDHDCKPLGMFIKRRTEKNNKFEIEKLIGVGMNGFIDPKQSKDETNGHICYKVYKNDFVFAPPQVHKGSIAIWNDDEIVKCSDAYIVFYITNDLLNANYLNLLLHTPFFQKYSFYYRDGVREQFDFDQLCEYEIPIPTLEIQENIVNIFNVYNKRKKYVDRLKTIIKDICPILIKGATEEGRVI